MITIELAASILYPLNSNLVKDGNACAPLSRVEPWESESFGVSVSSSYRCACSFDNERESYTVTAENLEQAKALACSLFSDEFDIYLPHVNCVAFKL